jgi:uncharacterized membrane protein (DUF373 family)
VQDALVAVLAVVFFVLMVRGLVTLARHAVSPDFSVSLVVAEALFVLVMVEATIVTALREVQLRGALGLDPLQLLALTVFVLALGFLLRFGDLRPRRRRVRVHGRRHGPADPRLPGTS